MYPSLEYAQSANLLGQEDVWIVVKLQHSDMFRDPIKIKTAKLGTLPQPGGRGHWLLAEGPNP